MKIDNTTVIIMMFFLTSSVAILFCLAHTFYKFMEEMRDSDRRFHTRISRIEINLGVNTPAKPSDFFNEDIDYAGHTTNIIPLDTSKKTKK